MDKEKLAELLKVSEGILDRGDGFRTVLAYLKREEADEETISSIMKVLDQKEKEREVREAPQRIKDEKLSFFSQAMGKIIIGSLLLIGCAAFTFFTVSAGNIVWLLPVGLGISGALSLFIGIAQLMALPFTQKWNQKPKK